MVIDCNMIVIYKHKINVPCQIKLIFKENLQFIANWVLFLWLWLSSLSVMITLYSPSSLLSSGNMATSLKKKYDEAKKHEQSNDERGCKKNLG